MCILELQPLGCLSRNLGVWCCFCSPQSTAFSPAVPAAKAYGKAGPRFLLFRVAVDCWGEGGCWGHKPFIPRALLFSSPFFFLGSLLAPEWSDMPSVEGLKGPELWHAQQLLSLGL